MKRSVLALLALGACGRDPSPSASSPRGDGGAAAAVLDAGTTPVDASAPILPPRERLAALAARRTEDWARRFDGWEVMFDGSDSPADPGDLRLPRHLAWDSPFDDDFGTPEAPLILLNTPAHGIYSVDRVTRAVDHGKTGNILRRDELIRNDEGLTVEVRAKIDAASGPRAFFIQHLFPEGSFAVRISPDLVDLGPGGNVAPTSSAAFAASSDFHTYRVVKQPSSLAVSVYVDNVVAPLLAGQGASLPALDDYVHPYVLVGDAAAIGVKYELDYVRYARGSFQWLSRLEPPSVRTPPPLPEPAPDGETFAAGYEGDVLPTSGIYQSHGSASGYTLHEQEGWLEIDTHTAQTSFDIVDPPELDGVGSYTIELRARILADTDERGLALAYLDRLGAARLAFSPKKVELSFGLKAANGISEPVVLDTTDDFHVYRLVHRDKELCVHLYVDGDPVPKVWDYHLEASHFVSDGKATVTFGHTTRPIVGPEGHAIVDYLRYKKGAVAPRLP